MSMLWWTARNTRPAPTSLGIEIALVGGVSTGTLDTGITDGSVGVMQLWVGNATINHIHILFGATDPVGDPDHDGYIVIETDGSSVTQPQLFLVTAKTQFFRLFSTSSRDIQYQVEEIQGE